MTSIYAQAELAWAISQTAHLHDGRSADLCRRLRVTELELAKRLEAGREEGVLQPGSGLELTEGGAFLASSTAEGRKDLSFVDRISQESYLGYTPSRWYPERRL